MNKKGLIQIKWARYKSPVQVPITALPKRSIIWRAYYFVDLEWNDKS